MLSRVLLFPLVLLVPQVSLAQAPELLPGSPHIAATRVRPGTVVRALHLGRGGQEQRLGTITETISVSPDGRRLIREQRIDMMGRARLDSAIVDRETLRPVRHSGRDGMQVLEVEFAGARVSGAVTAKGTRVPYDSSYAVPMFDANFLEPLIAALPLATGFSARLPIYIHERGGLLWADVAVQAEEAITVGGTTVTCWKVDATYLGVVTHLWIGRDDGTLWRLTSSPSAGISMRMDVER